MCYYHSIFLNSVSNATCSPNKVIPTDFSAFRYDDEDLKLLIEQFNKNGYNFKLGELYPYSAWFLVNLKGAEDELNELRHFGLI